MQTKQQIQKLLASAGVSPNKRFGQHFLIDLNLMRLLVESAGIHSNDIVLEVGCGTGSLTEELVQKAGRVVVAELDDVLAAITEKRL
ncbi:MAG: rRNA adenine N-6-methyltransferase family protein, partial [Planctomycetota bacterium]